MRTPVDTFTYNQAADSGHCIDEYTVLREMAISIGQIVMLFLLIGLTTVFSISVCFIVAAIASFGINILVDYHAKQT